MYKSVTIEEFLQFGIDLQKFIYSQCGYKEIEEYKIIDDDKKLAYYRIRRNVKLGVKGNFYKNSSLIEWIVYDRATKKVKLSLNMKSDMGVFKRFLSDRFKYWELMAMFIRKPTPTLVKKIIENKINCIRDIINYNRTYTFRQKELSDITIFKSFVYGKSQYLSIFEDPENVNWEDIETGSYTVLDQLASSKFFKIKSTDSKEEINGRYKRWIEEQGKEYDKISADGFSKIRDCPF